MHFSVGNFQPSYASIVPIFPICIILNIYKTFMLKKVGNKNKIFIVVAL